MKKQDKQEIKMLLRVAKRCVITAAHIANNGTPAPQDVAELMAAWGAIAKAVAQPSAAGNKAYTIGQLDMLAGLTGGEA